MAGCCGLHTGVWPADLKTGKEIINAEERSVIG